MKNTKIAWTEKTWNPVTGCTKCSEGCQNCYAENMAQRLKAMGAKGYEDGFKVTLHPERLNEPLKLKGRNMVFVCSMGDLFHEDVPWNFIDKVIDVIEATPNNTYQILTKRTREMEKFFSKWNYPRKNIWYGTTVENRAAKERIFYLQCIGNEMDNPPLRFLSCEPLLEDLGELDLSGIGWVIVGGESGAKARPMKEEWVLNIRRQCEERGVPFFFKQWGTWGADGVRRSKRANGCLLRGEVVRQWPAVINEDC